MRDYVALKKEDTVVTDIEQAPLVWRKSKASAQTNCVEVAFSVDSVLMRDSKNPYGAVLSISSSAWSAFLAATKSRDGDIQ